MKYIVDMAVNNVIKIEIFSKEKNIKIINFKDFLLSFNEIFYAVFYGYFNGLKIDLIY